MRAGSRWFLYILLNIVVSAAVTFTVIYLYDRYKGNQTNSPVNPVLTQVSQTEPINQGDVNIVIISVIGSGVVVTEMVVIRNDGADAVTMTGWILKNGDKAEFTFPQIKIFEGGILKVHTNAGANTAVDLYWGRTDPAWSSGDVASLYDNHGNLITTYLIP